MSVIVIIAANKLMVEMKKTYMTERNSCSRRTFGDFLKKLDRAVEKL